MTTSLGGAFLEGSFALFPFQAAGRRGVVAVPAWLSKLFQLDRLVLGVGLTALALAAYFLDQPQRLELMALDARFKIRGPKKPGPEVVVAVIDEKSLDQLGRWPWPRNVQAQLVDRLVSYGARVIGYDVTFSEPDTSGGTLALKEMKRRLVSAGSDGNSPAVKMLDEAIREADHDRIFARALKRSRRVILGYFFHWSRAGIEHVPERELHRSLQSIRGSKYRLIRKDPGVSLKRVPLKRAHGVESSIEPLSRAARGGGFFSVDLDSDGAVRWYPLIVKYRDMVEIPGEQDYLFAPLAIRVLERYLRANALFRIGRKGVKKVALMGRQRIEVPTNGRGEMFINFLGPRGTFPHYSIADIVLGREDAAPPGAFRDKIVLVGPTAAALGDRSLTPFDKSLPGVEIHATLIDNVLRRDFLVRPWWAPLFDVGLIVLLGVILMLVLPQRGALWGGASAALLLAAHLGLNYYLFAGPQWWLNATYPTLEIALVYAGITVQSYLSSEERQRRFIQRMASFIAHDLKNAAGVLSLVVENAARHMSDPAFLRAAFEDIAHSAERLKGLVSLVAHLPRGEPTRFARVDVNELLARVCRESGLEEGGQVELHKRLSPLPTVEGDAAALETVFHNLVKNALEAMGEGGTLTVETMYADGGRGASEVEVRISDTGPGMSPEFVKKELFKPFRSGKAGGVGIGLFQCLEIVKAHGGAIAVDSAPGRGTCFQVRLPVRQRARGEGGRGA